MGTKACPPYNLKRKPPFPGIREELFFYGAQPPDVESIKFVKSG
ncbi:hypothetical protein CPter291_2203 [Collimonas pratensis]|uniref:Uncharacterized protein n=1 Tax=Collimonas pratensis TaxID=279113 RepID=A0ABN4MDC2_9BURK|nr:hypothetical protein CPter291_2203 [Collimonas pratensis]